jgi:hypothetical protein
MKNKVLTEAWHAIKNALTAVSLADEILATTPIDQDITSTLDLARQSWKRLEAEQKKFIQACTQARRDK